jgi:hypothetical protein
MSDLRSAEPVSVAPSGTKPSDRAAFAQITAQAIALVLSFPAAIFGVFVVFSVASPQSCGGDVPKGLPVILCWLANLPLGVLSLAVGLFVKRGIPFLRKWCFRAGLVTLALPIIAQLLWNRWHCYW